MTEPTIREPEEIRRDCARKLRAVQVSDHFQAILGCLLGEDWTTRRLVEMVITPDGAAQMLAHADFWSPVSLSERHDKELTGHGGQHARSTVPILKLALLVSCLQRE